MNHQASQWVSVAGWLRTREQQLIRAGGMKASVAVPALPALKDPEVKEFATTYKDAKLDANDCRKLHISATYQAVLCDPSSEEEILQTTGFLKDNGKLDALYAYAADYAQKVESEARSELELREQSGGARRWFQVIALAFLLVFAGAGGWLYKSYSDMKRYLDQPAGTTQGKVTVKVPKGARPDTVSKLLREKGVILDQDRFYKLARYYHHWKRIFPQLPGRGQMRAGTYIFPTDLTPIQILSRLRKGPKRRSIRVTIPEGFNIYKIAARLQAKGICREDGFLYLARNKIYASAIIGWDTPSIEGYLYPDTYRFYKNTAPRKVIQRMVKRFKQLYSNAFRQRERELNAKSNHIVWTPHKVVTLASIIEKETGQKRERPMISSVFHNRLRRRWKLQTDPTIIYGLPRCRTQPCDIRKKDLRNPHKYNTYVHKGLPPGPIASPGVAAIRAALWPTKSRNMFFVSRNDGSHIFSRTLRQHNKFVKQYQSRRRALKKKP